MKKNLAFLLAAILLLTSMLGLTSAAEPETQAAQAPSQEIAYFNVSVKVGAKLLFAVPADGYDVSNVDGSVANLKLLVWEEGASDGSYSRLDAEKHGAILESQGKQKIGDKYYVVFSYGGLSASEMSKKVYARTLTTDSIGFRSYGQLYDYSVAEFANTYLNSETSAYKPLVEAMLDYGHFAADYKGQVSYTAEEVKALKKVTVKAMFGESELFTQTTQLAPVGTQLTLEAPHFDGYALSSWGEDVTDGKITVSDHVELVANYTPVIKEHYTINYDSAELGAYKGLEGSSGSVPGSFITGSTWDYAYGNLTVSAQSGVKCLKFAHNGAIQASFNKNFLGTNAGDTLDFSFQIKIMAAANGSFPKTEVNFYRLAWNDSTGSSANATPQSILVLDTNGDIILRDYNGNDVVLGQGSPDKFQTVTVVCDVSESKYIGYIDGVKCGETTMALNPTALYHSLEGGKNTSLYVCMYGGYQADDWKNIGFPKELVGEDKHFRFAEDSKGTYIVDKDTGLYRLLNTKNAAEKAEYNDAAKYTLSYTVDAALKTAVKDYVEANSYFYYTDPKVFIGDVMAQ